MQAGPTRDDVCVLMFGPYKYEISCQTIIPTVDDIPKTLLKVLKRTLSPLQATEPTYGTYSVSIVTILIS
jgi:hypothetical protein